MSRRYTQFEDHKVGSDKLPPVTGRRGPTPSRYSSETAGPYSETATQVAHAGYKFTEGPDLNKAGSPRVKAYIKSKMSPFMGPMGSGGVAQGMPTFGGGWAGGGGGGGLPVGGINFGSGNSTPFPGGAPGGFRGTPQGGLPVGGSARGDFGRVGTPLPGGGVGGFRGGGGAVPGLFNRNRDGITPRRLPPALRGGATRTPLPTDAGGAATPESYGRPY